MSEHTERVARGSKIIDGYGDDSSFDQLQGWDLDSQTAASQGLDDKFVSDMWRVFDTAGNLLLRKHHDYGPKNVAHSPGGSPQWIASADVGQGCSHQ